MAITQNNGCLASLPSSCAWSDVKVETHIGSGGFCMVLKAQYGNEELAIKCLKAGGLDPKQRLIASEGLEEAVRILANLNHPHVVSLHSMGNDPQSSPFFLMERLQDDTLAGRLRLWRKKKNSKKNRFWKSAKGALLPKGIPSLSERLSDIGIGLAQALDYLHQQKQIVHCDIKPDNVGFGRDGEVKLFDFGLSQDLSRMSPKEGRVIGSLRYMAPEVMQGQPVSFGADIYSFSLLLWELATLEKPFKDIKDERTIIKQVVNNHGRLSLGSIESEPLRCVLRSCWSSNPRMRLSSDRVLNGIEYTLVSEANKPLKDEKIVCHLASPSRRRKLSSKSISNVTQKTLEPSEALDF